MLLWWIANVWAQSPVDAGFDGVDTGMDAWMHEEGPEGIVNGQTTSAYPEVVSLATGSSENGPFYSFCTGSHVEASWVLTAAHCVVDLQNVKMPGDRLWIIWGSDMSGGRSDAVEWSRSISHEGYNPRTIENDIGLIELVAPRPDGPLMVVNDLPIDDTWTGRLLSFVGFGVTGTRLQDSGVKRTVDNPIVGHDASLVYAEDPNSGVCFGDSGGPSVILTDAGYEQVGVTSYGEGWNCEDGQHAHTRVDAYLDWLTIYVPNLLTEPPPDTPEGGAGGDFGFLDWGIEDPLPGLSGEWPDPENPSLKNRGCTHAGGLWPSWAWLWGLAVLIRRRG